jgi:hypothetical protein
MKAKSAVMYVTKAIGQGMDLQMQQFRAHGELVPLTVSIIISIIWLWPVLMTF